MPGAPGSRYTMKTGNVFRKSSMYSLPWEIGRRGWQSLPCLRSRPLFLTSVQDSGRNNRRDAPRFHIVDKTGNRHSSRKIRVRLECRYV